MDDQKKAYEITVPHAVHLDMGDLLVRVFLDPEQALPMVMVLEVTEMLGTIGAAAMISHKYRCVLQMDSVPDKITAIIVEMAQRRMKLKF
jgi:hypothetical protein